MQHISDVYLYNIYHNSSYSHSIYCTSLHYNLYLCFQMNLPVMPNSAVTTFLRVNFPYNKISNRSVNTNIKYITLYSITSSYMVKEVWLSTPLLRFCTSDTVNFASGLLASILLYSSCKYHWLLTYCINDNLSVTTIRTNSLLYTLIDYNRNI